MNQILLGLMSAVLATNTPQSVSNLIRQDTGVAISFSNTNDAEKQELDKLMVDDDAAMDEIDKWIRDNNAFAAQGAGESKEELNERILARLQTVRNGYEDFLKRHPDNADAYLAFGSFLSDTGDEQGGSAEYEKARELAPTNPAAWNDLANYYGENGPTTNAFVYYAKAIELNPEEPVYYENMATTVYLFRRDAMKFYGINETQVFDKALALYKKAVQLDPDNFALITDYAESYYGIRPLRIHDALAAWTNALEVAGNEFEREAVYIHLARIKIAAGRFAEAQAHLDAVTNSDYDTLKNSLERNLARREKEVMEAMATNVPTSSSGQKTP
jgi:tetratricopeptide (TPR) repeat protein